MKFITHSCHAMIIWSHSSKGVYFLACDISAGKTTKNRYFKIRGIRNAKKWLQDKYKPFVNIICIW